MNDWQSISLPFQIGSGRTLFSADPNDPRLKLDFRYSPSTQRLQVDVAFGSDVFGPPGHVHGGVLCYVLDEAMGSNAWAAGYPVVAGELQIRFCGMVPVQAQYLIDVHLVSIEKRKIKVRAVVRDQQGAALTEADGVFVRLSRAQGAQLIQGSLESFQWREEIQVAKRLDISLVELGLAPSRTHAQALIREGLVSVLVGGQWVEAVKPSLLVDATRESVRVRESDLSRYVSRGALKLKGALAHVGFNVSGFRVLDVGISTGGFTDFVLQAGASQVVGVDVGHGQLHPSLLGHVEHYEGVNARELSQFAPLSGREFDLIVVDVSFISLQHVLPQLPGFLKDTGFLLALVKPQFELGAQYLNKKGVVKDIASYELVRSNIALWCEDFGLQLQDYFASPIEGSDGNREFFVLATRSNR